MFVEDTAWVVCSFTPPCHPVRCLVQMDYDPLTVVIIITITIIHNIITHIINEEDTKNRRNMWWSCCCPFPPSINGVLTPRQNCFAENHQQDQINLRGVTLVNMGHSRNNGTTVQHPGLVICKVVVARLQDACLRGNVTSEGHVAVAIIKLEKKKNSRHRFPKTKF
ncbi:hypothetical protein E2C01_008062 [Portunus trituberculatus]|uniref:Uncharacterized protein n=1 Tax=Portunus trituberculatus TaxID=210409 RepID=A0A5B7D3V6_PORTR|nr:hypothetical protein [Portunus trituberculatus]